MRFVVLNVASPFAAVTPESDGPEGMIRELDAALVRAEQDSIVLASEGSSIQGILLSTARPRQPIDDSARQKARLEYRFILQKFLEKWPIDLIHMHGPDFHEYLPPPGVPVLVTLHDSPGAYPPEVFRLDRPRTYLHCATTKHRASCPPCANLLDGPDDGRPVVDHCFAAYERLIGDARGRTPIPHSAQVTLSAAL
jgi:hypothetical protein